MPILRLKNDKMIKIIVGFFVVMILYYGIQYRIQQQTNKISSQSVIQMGK